MGDIFFYILLLFLDILTKLKYVYHKFYIEEREETIILWSSGKDQDSRPMCCLYKQVLESSCQSTFISTFSGYQLLQYYLWYSLFLGISWCPQGHYDTGQSYGDKSDWVNAPFWSIISLSVHHYIALQNFPLTISIIWRCQ